MRKNIVQLELEVEGKRYQFICENDSPLAVIKSVLLDFHTYCDNLEKEIIERIQKEKEEQTPQEIKPEEIEVV